MRLNALILTVGCFLLLSGCANLNPMPADSEQLQKETIARWQQCLDRQSSLPETTNMGDVRKELRSRCEGHRRDVLLSFPAAMEPQLNTLLLKHTLSRAFAAPAGKSIGFPQPLTNLSVFTTIHSAR